MRKMIPDCLLYLFFAALACSSCTCRPSSGDKDGNRTNTTIVGISCAVTDNNSRIGRKYSEAVIKAGGIPLLLPVTADTAALSGMLGSIDALILTGGEDLNPAIYGEEPHPALGTIDTLRDTYDLYLVRTAVLRGIPVLGICRGCQLINIAFGGTLYQDIPSQRPSETDHYQSFTNTIPIHAVHPVAGTWIAKIAGTDRYMVNSTHHQAAKDIAPGFRAAAWSPADSIVEAIECTDGRPVWGVQFHPEGLTAGGDTTALGIFRFIVAKGQQYRQSR